MSTDTTRRESGSLAFVLGIVLVVGGTAFAVWMAMLLANAHFRATKEDARLARAEQARRDCAENGILFLPRVEPAALPVNEPRSETWALAPALDVELTRQAIAMPMLEQATIPGARLQGLTDGEHVVWRVSWRDPSLDANVDSGRFSDAVALQFPVTRNAAFTMGARRQSVQILHWKALWQKDVDEHFQDVQDVHPNYWADLYWFAEGRPYRLPDSFKDPRSHQWLIAYSAGNPLSDINRLLPVEELSAEGFGTLTTQPESVTMGRGSWSDGEWVVVFARPLSSMDEADYQFWRGGSGQVSVAVWEGSDGNVGGRKHYSTWLEFQVSP